LLSLSWHRRFDEPIELPGGGKLVTLKDAIAWLAKEIPQSEHLMKEVQAAAHCVTEAAENDGPMMFARMSMMQAITGTSPWKSTRNRKARIGENGSSGGTNDRRLRSVVGMGAKTAREPSDDRC
jgi:hypothetical protein